jgi:hypothetical protein
MIDKIGIDYAERRLYKRGPGMRLPCLLSGGDGQDVNCALLDISPVGAMVKLDIELNDGERVDLSTVQRLVVASLVNFPAEAIWQDGQFAGFRFLSNDQEAAVYRSMTSRWRLPERSRHMTGSSEFNPGRRPPCPQLGGVTTKSLGNLSRGQNRRCENV